jgi:hypothetical protein
MSDFDSEKEDDEAKQQQRANDQQFEDETSITYTGCRKRSKRLRYWPLRKRFNSNMPTCGALEEKWCNAHLRGLKSCVSASFHSDLPVMFRRIMNPLDLMTLSFYAEEADESDLTCLAQYAVSTGYECHPSFFRYEAEIAVIGDECACKYGLGPESVPDYWKGHTVIAILPKKDADGVRFKPKTDEEAHREFYDRPEFSAIFLFLLDNVRKFATNMEVELNARVNKMNSAFGHTVG